MLKISYLLSIITRKIIVWGKPYSISIEPGSFCNLACEFCPSGQQELLRNKGNIDIETNNRILEQTHQYLLNLFYYFQGEPFLNPDIFEMVKSASDKKIYTVLSTNGHFLSIDNSIKIISSGLDKIIISLDGLDQDSYSTYRKKGNYFEVVKGIENLVKTKREMNSSSPFIEIQFLVFRHNQHQIKDIKKFGKYLGANKISLKTAQVYDVEDNKTILPTIPKFSRYIESPSGIRRKKIISNRCKRLWDSCVFTWNGDVVPCCYDKDAEFVMGNINQNKFTEIWKNEKYQDFRQTILTNRKSVEICRNCDE